MTKIERKTLIDDILGQLQIKLYYVEQLGNGRVKTGFVMGSASSYSMKSNFPDVRRRAIMSALYAYEKEKGTNFTGTNEFLQLRRNIRYQIVDWNVFYYKQFLQNKIKRVNRNGKYYTFVFQEDGKIKTTEKWRRIDNAKLYDDMYQDFEDLGVEE